MPVAAQPAGQCSLRLAACAAACTMPDHARPSHAPCLQRDQRNSEQRGAGGRHVFAPRPGARHAAGPRARQGAQQGAAAASQFGARAGRTAARLRRCSRSACACAWSAMLCCCCCCSLKPTLLLLLPLRAFNQPCCCRCCHCVLSTNPAAAAAIACFQPTLLLLPLRAFNQPCCC